MAQVEKIQHEWKCLKRITLWTWSSNFSFCFDS